MYSVCSVGKILSLLCWLVCIGAAAASAAEPADLKARVTSHGFPAIFQAWSPMQNLNRAPDSSVPLAGVETRMQTMAHHDLVFVATSELGLVWNDSAHEGLSTGFTPESVRKARAFKAQLLSLNPHAVLLVEIRYHDAKSGYFPDDSPWWKRDAAGQRIRKTQGTALDGYYLIDLSQPGLQDQIATLCAAAIDTGAVDGCMLDWWANDDADHVAIARKIREKIGDRGLLLVNVNGKLPVHSAEYINGMYMEGFGASFFADWKTAVKNLQWGTAHLRPPAITAFEMWYPVDTPEARASGPNDLAKMRMATTLALCNSDGYLLYSAGFPTSGHPHDWYPFWKQSLGAPDEPAGRINPNGSYGRNFQNGTAVFNPPGNQEVNMVFKTPVTRQSNQKVGTLFTIPPGDGEIFCH